MMMMKNLLISLLLFLPIGSVSSQNKRTNVSPKREVRAVWLTTIGGLDWPSHFARSAAGIARQQAELCSLLDSLQAAHINTVLLQTRVRATVIYPSQIEPWDGCMSGVPGVSPGYDPLAFAIEACHHRGMELHAWIVAFPAHKMKLTKQLGRQAINVRQPAIVKKAGDMWMLDPGVPQTADYLARLCAEVVEHYDVDGIHLDYIRYPEKEITFTDAATYRRYGKGQPKAEWRRQNVTRCVRAVHEAVKRCKPWVKMSCSPVGKYADLSRFSSRGWNAYDAVSQDAQGWLRQGLMDLLFPMMYFQGDHFYPFALDWTEQAGGKPIVPGLGIYFLSEKEKNWDFSVIQREMNFLREIGAGGQGYFRSRFFTNNVKGIYDFAKTEYYPSLALPPAMTWLDSVAPSPPVAPQFTPLATHTQLTWHTATDGFSPCPPLYNVYRSSVYPVDTRNPAHLVAMKLADTCWTTPREVLSYREAYYAVTSIDRFGNESAPVACNVPSLAVRSPRLPLKGQTVTVPFLDTEFLMIQDVVGQGVATVRFTTQLSVAHLSLGVYTLRTLDANGRSRRIGHFVKK
ncbi:MAG: family 10 glycosylhydrolase [Bacteroidaceae bacterium]